MRAQKLAAAGIAAMMFVSSTVFAEEGTSSSQAASTASSSSRGNLRRHDAEQKNKRLNRGVEKGKLDLACVKTAVTVREDALVAAITARRNALVDAWSLSDATARNDGIKAVWKTFKEARKTAWTTF